MELQNSLQPATMQPPMAQTVEILPAESMAAITRVEIDTQIATAKHYPRNLTNVINNITTLAMLDQDTAAECFYVLHRQGRNGTTEIQGASVRFAEIVASCWGNIRVQTYVTGNNGREITVVGMCHDLERNAAMSVEVKRSILTKTGQTFSQDMQVVTANAAAAIAFRNAVFKVVPKAVLSKIIEQVKQVSLGKSLDLTTSRQKAIEHFNKIGVKTETLFKLLEVKSVEEIDQEKVWKLRGIANAIKEGDTTIQETFGHYEDKPAPAASEQTPAQKKAAEARQRIAAKSNPATAGMQPNSLFDNQPAATPEPAQAPAQEEAKK